MSWFQLDSESVAARVQASGLALNVPRLGTSLRRGIVGFTVLSIAGFVPWAIFGRWFYRNVGEAGLYVVCAVVFIGLSGPLMHRLIIGPGSLSRFYKLFAVTFAAYSTLWIAGWMALRGHPGSLAGLLAGTAAMGWMLARAFDARGATLKLIAILFVLNSLGYFIGGWVEGGVMAMKQPSLFGAPVPKRTQMRTAMLLWGVFYGLGFGAGLGWAFHLCQTRTRAALGSIAS
jgi:hypothetical protein